MTLYKGDCMEITQQIAAVNVTITDPPYGVSLGAANNQSRDASHLAKQGYRGYDDTYDQFCSEIVPRLNAAIDIAERAAVFSGPHIHEQRKPVAVGGVFVPCATGRTPWGSKQFLPLLLYGNPSRNAGCHRPTILTSTDQAEKNGHPCPKPLSWMLWAVEFASEPGHVVFDPFMGSGTTAIACIQSGREFIGVERDEEYFSIAVRRIDQALNIDRDSLWTAKQLAKETQQSLFGEEITKPRLKVLGK